MSAALHRDAAEQTAAAAAGDRQPESTPAAQPGEATLDREDFFHVIQAAKEQGIGESDAQNIWSS
jgi:hypothetical protein